MDMTIRLMNMNDYDAVYALWLSCTGMGLNDIDDSKDGIARFLARNPDTCFVAEHDNKIIGVIMAGNDGRRGYIYHTAVARNFRHQGIGTELVNATMRELEALGITKVALVSFRQNESGNAFWEAQGFTVRNDLVYRNKTIKQMTRIDT